MSGEINNYNFHKKFSPNKHDYFRGKNAIQLIKN